MCTDIPHYQLIQRVLRDEIVNPLRTNFYVRADRVMKLRTLMKEELKDVSFTTEEKGYYINFSCIHKITKFNARIMLGIKHICVLYLYNNY